MLSTSQIIERLFEAWRSGDALYAAAHFEAEAKYQEAAGPALYGRDQIAEHFTRFFRDGPRWRIDVDDIIAEDSVCAVVYRFSLEGKGNRWRERAGCAVVRFNHGLITHWREYEG